MVCQRTFSNKNPGLSNSCSNINWSFSFEDYEKSEKYYKKASKDIYQKLKPQQSLAKERAKQLGIFDFENPSAAKAEIWRILDLLGLE